jgi:dihydroflavonol-4-reductase
MHTRGRARAQTHAHATEVSLKRALVTGATGFLGASVARELLERGRDVRLLVRPTSDLGNVAGLDAELFVGDLRDAAAVSDAVAGCDEVYHVAAEYTFWSTRPAAIYETNVGGTVNVMQACLEHEVARVVYTSTVGTIGLGGTAGDGGDSGTGDGATGDRAASEGGASSDVARRPREGCDERSPFAPNQICGHYKSSKLEAEKTALAYVARGLPLVVVNPSAPVGPWDHKPTPTGKIIVDFVRGRMPAYLDTGLNVVHVRDVAVGHVLAAEKGRVGERYILGHRNMSLAEIFGALGALTGRAPPKIRIPYGAAYVAGLVSTTIADHLTHAPPGVPLEAVSMARFAMFFSAAKAVRELGLPQTPVTQAFVDALDWFGAHGYFDLRRARPTAEGGRAWQYR